MFRKYICYIHLHFSANYRNSYLLLFWSRQNYSVNKSTNKTLSNSLDNDRHKGWRDLYPHQHSEQHLLLGGGVLHHWLETNRHLILQYEKWNKNGKATILQNNRYEKNYIFYRKKLQCLWCSQQTCFNVMEPISNLDIQLNIYIVCIYPKHMISLTNNS